MSRRRKPAEDFARLRELGLELDPPVDEFSEQPGSGSAIGGRRGAQEYGIVGGVAQENAHDINLSSNVDAHPSDLESDGQRFPRELMDKESAGISEYSANHIMMPEESESNQADEEGEQDQEFGSEDLKALLQKRLNEHPELGRYAIQADVGPDQFVRLDGRVHTEAERLLAQELAEAVAGGSAVHNQITIGH